MEENIRAFVSIELPDRVKSELFRVANSLNSPEIRVVAREHLHMTLFFFARMNDDQVKEIIRALESIEQESFEAIVTGFEVFNSKHPGVVFAKVDDKGALSKMFEAMEPSVLDAGLDIEEREFTPHITVARTRRFDKHTIERIEGFVNEAKISCAFAPVSITLKQSILTSTGPIYKEIYSKPFGAVQG